MVFAKIPQSEENCALDSETLQLDCHCFAKSSEDNAHIGYNVLKLWMPQVYVYH